MSFWEFLEESDFCGKGFGNAAEGFPQSPVFPENPFLNGL